MCPSCSDYLDSLAGCSAKVASKWTCPLCGPQEFAKEADPAPALSIWPDPVMVMVVAFMALVGLMVAFSK